MYLVERTVLSHLDFPIKQDSWEYRQLACAAQPLYPLVYSAETNVTCESFYP